jgi:uncharacterized protein
MSGAVMTVPSIARRHQAGTSRGTFDLETDGKPGGYLSYALTGDSTMIVEFVEVDPALRGRGMGERLVGAAVEWARANGRQIVPHCAYARVVLERTAAYRDVLKP